MDAPARLRPAERQPRCIAVGRTGWREAPGWFDQSTRPPRPFGAPLLVEEGTYRGLLLAARLVAFDFLADARPLARELAHVIELRAAHVAFPLELDRIDRRRIGLESAF